MHAIEQSEHWTLAGGDATTLQLQTPAGDIRCEASHDGQIQVQAVKRVTATTPAAARALMDQIKIERRREGDRWVVEASWPEFRRHGANKAVVTFHMRVPREMLVEAWSGAGSIEANGLCNLRLRTADGNLRAGGTHQAGDGRSPRGATAVVTQGGVAAVSTGGSHVRIHQSSSSQGTGRSGNTLEVRIGGRGTGPK